VAPPGYQFSFSDAIDPGTRLSWQGGRHWQDVVRDMLAPAGLSHSVRDGNVIVVRPKGAGTAPMQTLQVTPPATAAAAVETQEIRRRKPSSFMDRMRSQFAGDDGMGAPVPPPAPVATLQPEERVVEPVPVPTPVAEELTAQEDLSPIALTARAPQGAAPAVVRPPETARSEAVVGNSWQARGGDTLRDVIGGWSARAGVDLHWSIDYDYRLPRDVEFTGGYTDAVTALLDQFRKAKPRPYAQLHRQAGQQQVLVIKAYGVNE
jgi:hypothetical protein